MAVIRHIGLTGGIGSGKSTVSAALQALGACLVDTDALSRELTAPGGAAMAAIRDRFGAPMVQPDGALDRARMRALVFGDDSARRALEGILHPLISELADQRAAQAAPDQWVVFDVPLLVESGRWRARVQRVIVVDCEEATQVGRVTLRPGWTREAAERVVAQQAPRSARRAAADAVIHNDGIDLTQLQAHVRALWLAWH